MSTPTPATNHLIDSLPLADAQSLLGQCHVTRIEFGLELNVSGAPITCVHFPTTAIISRTAEVSGHNPLEIGMIGHEGVLGGSIALGVDRHAMRAIVQGAGYAQVIQVADFQTLLRDSRELERAILGYLFVVTEQLAQTAACNAFHEVSARLARWLLMMDDRARGAPLVLTHVFLADMLGVRRSAVTIAAGRMQESKLIQYARGHIQVLSRPGLESLACECYPSGQAAYDRQFSCH